MAFLNEINSLHWQPSISQEDSVVQGIRDIDQCIRIILLTPKGSDIHRPDFGTDLNKYIDMPINRAKPFFVREITEAVKKWEPRCVLSKVIVTIDNAHLKVIVQWRLAEDFKKLINETTVLL